MNKVIFKDQVFKQAVCDLFDLDETMTLEDLSKIEEIVFYDSGKLGEGEDEQYFVKLNGKIKSLEDLQYFPNLKNLALNFSDPDEPQIWGELKDVMHLNKLEKLNLSASQITGDTSQVKHLTKLKELIITGEGITGKLSDIQGLTQLERMNFIDTKITGNLDDLIPLDKLKAIVTAWTEIKGDIKILSLFKNLERIDCNNDSENSENIFGDISVFKKLPKLKDISMYSTNITGDLSNLEDLTNLCMLGLGSTKVQGDIKSLEKLTKIEDLDLVNTVIKGELKSLASLNKLEYLVLDNCQEIRGDIKDLAHLEKLKALSLYNTLVSGNPIELAKLPQLKECNLLCSAVKNNEEIQEQLSDLAKDEIILLDSLYEEDDYDDIGEEKEEDTNTEKEYRYNNQDLELLENFRQDNIALFENVYKEVVSDELKIDLYISKPTDTRDYYIVMTQGMGAFKMNVPHEVPQTKSNRYAEILCYLPSDWNFDFKEDEDSYWPLGTLKMLARLPFEDKIWLGEFHTIGNGETFSKNTKLCATILTKYVNLKTNTIEPLSVKLSDDKIVDILTMIPIYDEELRFKKEINAYDLLRELKHSVGLKEMAIINPNRAKAIFGEPEFEDYETYKDTQIRLENPEQIVSFEDEGFEEAIRKLYKLEGEIRHKDIGYIEKMDFSTYIKNGVIDIYHIDFEKKIKSLKDLKWFPNLLSLSLCGNPGDPIFFGELKDILVLKRLVALDTAGAIIKGDIKDLKVLSPKMKEITITGQGLRGKLSDIAGFKNLECLYICDTRVTGDLSDISHLSNLDYLCLSYSLFTGDIKELKNMSKMKDLSLDDSKIKGDIKHLANMKDLEQVSMGDIKVKGDIAVFANMPNLREIELYSTNVSGNIENLKHLSEIRRLDISYTDIEGNIITLKDLPVLREVLMYETQMDYEVSDFEFFDKVDFECDELDEDDEEYDDENEQENEEEEDELFECIWHRKTNNGYEYFEFIQLDDYDVENPKGEYRQAMVGESSIIQTIDMEDANTLLDKKREEGFSNIVEDLKEFHFTIADFPRVNPESLVDSISKILDELGLGYVENYEVLTISDTLPDGYNIEQEINVPKGKTIGEKELLIMSLVIDEDIAKAKLDEAFSAYGIQFGFFAKKIEQE